MLRFSAFQLSVALTVQLATSAQAAAPTFRAGASVVDISPTGFPVLVNAMFTERSASQAVDPLSVQALVLDDGTNRLALVVVDTCMMARDLIDQAKEQASQATGIPTARMLVSATHTHSAPSAMGCLGSRMDTNYATFLWPRIAQAIVGAAANLAPARIGWAVADDWDHTFNRRWIRRPDRLLTDPFGDRNIRAHMHPGHESPDAIGPSGPVDPGLTVLAVQSLEGHPVALLANYSQHYYGSPLLSSDYYGRFREHIARLTGATNSPFVGMMSQGTSGDLMWMDYGAPRRDIGYDAYALEVARNAFKAYQRIQYRDWVPLRMAERKLSLNFRTPAADRLAWARGVAASLGDRLPQSQPEIYALEALHLHERPTAELKLQALRIGELGIAAMPNEVYAITGLKVKLQSPLQPTCTIELANGGEGYIPPPEQHHLGGYTTWPARTAGLEREAEPKIVDTILELLEEVSGEPRRPIRDEHGPYAKAIQEAKPLAYWRLNEIAPQVAHDASGNNHPATYEEGVAFYLPGPGSGEGLSPAPALRPSNFSGQSINRAPHFCGGRLQAELEQLGPTYSVELWFWNGLMPDGQERCLFTRSAQGGTSGDHLGLTGAIGETARLFIRASRGDALLGTTEIPFRTWCHVVLVREGNMVAVYLNGNHVPEIHAELALSKELGGQLFIGGSADNQANFEGKIDEVAVYNRALTALEVSHHEKLSGMAEVRARRAEARVQATRKAAAAAQVPLFPPTLGDAMRALHPALDEVILFDRALTSMETFQLHQASGQLTQPIPVSSQVNAETDSLPLNPQESLKKLHVRSGFVVELVAAEPMVIDPVAIDWDTAGRLWVVEMADYPLGLDGNGQAGGRIRVLEDLDQDGRYDRSSLFAEDLSFPTALMTWRDGVLVTAAPDILFLKDSDSDGRADVREVLYSGFTEGNQQLRVNGLRWGLDNWIYCASGGHHPGYGTQTHIKSMRTGREVALGSRDFRIRPDTGEIDPQSGPSQFGRNRDNWGHWFGTQNVQPIWHYLLADHYLRRNPHVPVSASVKKLLTPGNPELYPASPPEKRYHNFQEAGHFTSACSGMIYRDQLLFPTAVQSHAFVCEPFHNLVHHRVLSDAGVSFQSERAPEEAACEFLASEDRWFRPVMARTGPDGALWVVDMYRYMIEHPDWLPEAGKAELSPHYRKGDDKGRVYRVYPANTAPPRVRSAKELDAPGWVAALASPNGWQRDKAQQWLLEHRDRSAVPLLIDLAKTHPSPLARLHALWTLDGLDALQVGLLKVALADSHPEVRRNALQMSERLPADRVLDAVTGWDLDDKNKLQLACTLGQWDDPRAGEALARLAVASAPEATLEAAILSSAVPHSLALAKAVACADDAVQRRWFRPLIELALGIEDWPAMAELLQPLLVRHADGFTSSQLERFALLLRVLDNHRVSLQELAAHHKALDRQLQSTGALFAFCSKVASDDQRSDLDRVQAAALLALDASHRSDALTLLARWLTPRAAIEVQSAAVDALANSGEASIPARVIEGWEQHPPRTRQLILDALMTREPWIMKLLRTVKAGKVSVHAFDPARRVRLLKHRSEPVRLLASELFETGEATSRPEIVEAFRPALALAGATSQGAVLHAQLCASCHPLKGPTIGPDLRSVADQPPEKLLVNILDPNASVEPRYAAYYCELNNGEELYGLIEEETATGLTMKLLNGTTRTFLRSQIASVRASELSLMPEGLEAGLSHQDMADLIRFLSRP